MLDGKIAFVTGASQGIGREIAIKLADEGANVALAARSDGIYETQSDISSDATIAVKTDVTDSGSVESSIEETAETFGGLDCVVNNAGIAGPTAPIEEVSESEWEKTLDVNLTGMYRTVKFAGPYLRESDHGSIINISSISGKRPLENRTPYTASKMGVMGLTRTLAFEFGPNVTVNSICPGPVLGERIKSVVENQADEMGVSYREAERQLFLEDLALDEIVDPEDIGNLVAYLASKKGSHITAQDINVDCGATWY
jgi:NAD(P)-dependent dehydrogenase (short-subunit alcohol dehydrogenase family)